MYNRAEVIDKNFLEKVAKGQLPSAHSQTTLLESGLNASEVIDLFESQIMSRQLDLVSRELKATGDSYYTIGSAGHEGNAAVAKAFSLDDMAFLHYRSGAFMMQRAKQLTGSTPIYDSLLSFMSSTEEPIAGGRHKVWGSLELNVPPQTSTIASHLPKAVGAALSIARAHEIGIKSCLPKHAAVLCSFGDASANHSTAQGAFNAAAWVSQQNVKLPIVFVCEDNRLGISVPTANDWIKNNFSQRYGIKYFHADGLNILDAYAKAKEACHYVRTHKKPVFFHLETVRLLGHAGSDVESLYHSLTQIEAAEAEDPLLHTARIVIENSILTPQQVIALYQSIGQRIRHVSDYAKTRPRLSDPQQVASTITSCRHQKPAPIIPADEKREAVFGKDFKRLDQEQHMAKLLNWGLTDLMLQYPNSVIFGEDVAKKGGVYHVTDGLYKKFSQKRVFNSLLDEQSILGTAIGMAHNGFLPIPEIQFLAYIHNAEDQLRGEAATLAFFSQGQYTNPMVIRIAGLAYQKGFGGHFHNDNSIAIFRDIPGVIVAVPSNGKDAVTMLRTCMKEAYENGRVVVFIEPIALYMIKDLHQEGDKGWCFPYPEASETTKLGQMAEYGDGDDYTIISYGNGVYLSMQAMKELENKNLKGRLIDLRWLSQIDRKQLVERVGKSKKVLIVEECRKTGSLSEEIVTILVEEMDQLPKIKVHAAIDCFIPLGPGAAGGLPSKESIVQNILEMKP